MFTLLNRKDNNKNTLAQIPIAHFTNFGIIPHKIFADWEIIITFVFCY